MANEKKFKEYEKVYIDEHLTPVRAKMSTALRKDEDIKSVWTIDGKICCTKKTEPDKKIIITNPEDLFSKLGWSEEKMRASQLFIDLQ